MERVVLESPFAAPTIEGINENIAYARACIRDCLKRGEAPIASHLLFTQEGILRDDIPGERALGIAAGLAWQEIADKVVVYTDRGMSKGMTAAVAHAQSKGKFIEYRTLYPDSNFTSWKDTASTR